MTQPRKTTTKSDKATVLKRVDEVLRILLAGGEFADIRQYASTQGWRVSERQLRRYLKKAYTKLAKVTNHDQQQLMGRHLMQRHALYARALKTNDIRTALHVLRDEAELQGLYDLPKQKGQQKPATRTTSVSLRERFRRLLAARLNDDPPAIKLLDEAAPRRIYPVPDTWMLELTLNSMTVLHVAEQLDRAALALLASSRLAQGDQMEDFWVQVSLLNAWQFKLHRDGWRMFIDELGIDPDLQISANYQGLYLEVFGEQLAERAPTIDQIRKMLDEHGQADLALPTAEDIAQQSRELLESQLARASD